MEAYVTGHLADLYARAGWSVPPWVLLNRLAHCSIEELADFVAAGRSFRRHRGPRPWFVAELALAERLITLGRTPNGLRRIQLDILIPVELALAASAKIGRLTPGQVVGATTAALDAYAV